MEKLFDDWPERYEAWFKTPIGSLIKKYEARLILELLRPGPAQTILDAGCGTGVFTFDFLSPGARIVGLDISLPMLRRALKKGGSGLFHVVSADLSKTLPFKDETFDKVVSVTAIEFIEDAQSAVKEMFRVAKKKGMIVVATLNSLSPWAVRRKREAERGHPIFKEAIFRSPVELQSLAPGEGLIRTAIHFQKEDDVRNAVEIEKVGWKQELGTGAFVAVRWTKP